MRASQIFNRTTVADSFSLKYPHRQCASRKKIKHSLPAHSSLTGLGFLHHMSSSKQASIHGPKCDYLSRGKALLSSPKVNPLSSQTAAVHSQK